MFSFVVDGSLILSASLLVFLSNRGEGRGDLSHIWFVLLGIWGRLLHLIQTAANLCYWDLIFFLDTQ